MSLSENETHATRQAGEDTGQVSQKHHRQGFSREHADPSEQHRTQVFPDANTTE